MAKFNGNKRREIGDKRRKGSGGRLSIWGGGERRNIEGH